MGSKIWFITGVSRGFGKALAEAALAKGDTVIGTTRDGTAPITDETGRLNVLPLDVTAAASIPSIIKRAVDITGRLDVIVNNAGYGLLGSVEEASENDIEHLFDVNFHGTRRVVQAVLPYLRQQKSGHIVNITSIAGLAPSAGSGFYAATKFAVEGLSQSLAQEVAPLGIKVTLVEPGAFRTDFLSEHSIRIKPMAIEDYAATAGQALTYLEKMAGTQAGDPQRAADAIIRAVEANEPPLHLVLGPDAFRRTREKQERFAIEIERWKDVSLSTNFK
ncbi:short-chain dehydrogenase/reductase SDR [Burkholderia multivorans]|uniref:oxidoreductase n=1 Tax=Burkholderia multivorans TaxID=87883 RepID=UPI00198CF5D2|nr:oxidoreductase [Burkholderia multivorans]CAB5285569.1 short-chain dehydrogenase/reductase SDR [Burkholderia multivorans]CAB5302538.1 short-chain dehydrogenase/reductase SDR [Burkholderia multivorans]CAB5302707.1 short-chain dehydrogenase/reductase SDR [Burkholderia multivorans]CAB5303688.1 short-chain dehydrogenase/reductase SDR [Burkholderia multivorans]CAB5304215.1 short-chain dehydrogenase/reductase SDR [Burkholderia multivorans]